MRISLFKGDRKFFAIVFFILVLVFIIAVITPTIIDYKEENWREELASKVWEIETTVTDLYKDKEEKLLTTKDKLKEDLLVTLSPPNTSNM
jgi:hypothetical protein